MLQSVAAAPQPVFDSTANFFAYQLKKMPDSTPAREDAKVLSDFGA
jgi:hypothetical protein